MDLINPSPTFSDGQVLSASAHLNGLALCVQDLHDSVLSIHEAFCGNKSSVRAYESALRHKYNLLDWSYTIVSGTASIVYHDAADVQTTIPGTTHTGAGTYSGQADLSGLGFVVGDYYSISIGGGGSYEIWLIRETRSPSYPTLAAFNDEVVYTAAQWQALSDYVEELALETTFPYTPLTRVPTNTVGSQFIGTMHHQCRYLHLEIRWGGTISVKINGAEVGPFTGGPVGEWWDPAGNISPDIDLDGIASPPDYSDDYTIEISTDSPGMLYTLYEWPGETDNTPGWQALPTWAHGDYVYGSTTAKKIAPIVTDLGLLQSMAKYQNYPCNRAWVTIDWRFQMRRHYRYLHYYHDNTLTGLVPNDPMPPHIAYLIGDSYHEQSMTTPAFGASPWVVFDLDTVDKLWPSTFYLITGCRYCFEDVEP